MNRYRPHITSVETRDLLNEDLAIHDIDRFYNTFPLDSKNYMGTPLYQYICDFVTKQKESIAEKYEKAFHYKLPVMHAGLEVRPHYDDLQDIFSNGNAQQMRMLGDGTQGKVIRIRYPDKKDEYVLVSKNTESIVRLKHRPLNMVLKLSVVGGPPFARYVATGDKKYLKKMEKWVSSKTEETAMDVIGNYWATQLENQGFTPGVGPLMYYAERVKGDNGKHRVLYQAQWSQQLDEDLETTLYRKIPTKEFESMLTQVGLLVGTAQRLGHLVHNDLFRRNVMYERVPKSTKIYYEEYVRDGPNRFYAIPTYGKLWKLIDFGRIHLELGDLKLTSDRVGDVMGNRYDPTRKSLDLQTLIFDIMQHGSIPKGKMSNPWLKLMREGLKGLHEKLKMCGKDKDCVYDQIIGEDGGFADPRTEESRMTPHHWVKTFKVLERFKVTKDSVPKSAIVFPLLV